MSVYGLVPVAAIVPVFPCIVHMPALQRDHLGIACDGSGLYDVAHIWVWSGMIGTNAGIESGRVGTVSSYSFCIIFV